MFRRIKDKMWAEKRHLEMKLQDERDRHQRTKKLLEYVQDCMNVERVRRERDEARQQLEEARAEIKKIKGELFDAEGAAREARRESRRLERRLELMNAEPMRYVVTTEGREVSVTAVTHDEIPDDALLLLDRDEAVVAKFNTYSSYQIEPLPAE